MAIYFYSKSEQYSEFSNFSKHPISLHGKTWPSVEHFYQSGKFTDDSILQSIANAPTAKGVKEIADANKERINSDHWDDTHRVKRMREALEQKFFTTPELKILLLSTGDEELVHYSKDDLFWGDPGDGSGQNVLGKMLMELRDKLRESES